jgi:prephenate dehydrogenase
VPPVPFRRVAIVGAGLIGGSIGLALRRRAPRVRVVAVDRPAALRRALRRGAAHEGAPSLARGLRGADLIVLAAPVDAILDLLPRLPRLADPGAAITDVAGTKEAVLRAARRAGLARRFVGGHPMAGSERSGVAHADPGLFRGATWIVCAAGADRSAIHRVRALARLLGARPVVMDARRHDRLAARLSHLPQLASVALVNAAARGAGRGAAGLAGPAFRQMSRVAASDPGLWRGILATNRRAAAAALADLARETARLRRALGRGARAEFRRAARARAAILG